MTGPWKNHLAGLRQVVDANLGERFKVEPMLTGQYGSGPDPARPVFDIEQAHLRVAGGQDDLGGIGSRSWSTLLAGGEAEIHIDPEIYPSATSLRKGDQITALNRAGEPRFEVSRLDRDQKSRLVIQLSLKS